ncbi:MAG: glycosyltransferase family 39 protein [Anaerolineae bacterium]
MAEHVEETRRLGLAEGVLWPALTLEAVVYAVLLLGAAAMRFAGLGRWPLLRHEAEQALLAWRFLHGEGASSAVVPLLFDGALLGFFAFGASDAVARLLPALLGALLPLVPLLLRRRLGTWGALTACFVLSFSPLLVFYSRTLAGVVPMLAGTGSLLVAWELASQKRTGLARVAAVAGLAIAMTSSPWAYTFLLAVALYGFWGWLTRRRGREWHAWAPSIERFRLLLGSGQAGLGLALAVVLLSTALLLHPIGLQGTANLLAVWLGRLVPGSSGKAWGHPMLLLTFYEAGTVILGLLGAVVSVRRRDGWGTFLAVWAGLNLLLALVAGGRDGEPVTASLLPLALLAGLWVQDLAMRMPSARWRWVGGNLALLVCLLGFWWLQAAAYLNPEVSFTRAAHAQVLLALVAGTPLAMIAATAVLWQFAGRREAAWALLLVGLGLAGSLLFRQAVSLNHEMARDAREPLLETPTSPNVRDLVAFLEDWSIRRTLDQHALTVSAGVDTAPILPWYLREFEGLRLRRVPEADTDAGAVLRLASGNEAQPVPAGYVRTRYRVSTSADEPLGDLGQAFGYWLLRVAGGPVQEQRVELWVKIVKE